MHARSALLVAALPFACGIIAVFACTPEEVAPPPITTGFPEDFATVGHDPFFPIGPGAKHALSGTIDCNGCHGGMDTFSEFTCLGCHARNQAGADDLSDKHEGMGDRFALEDARCYSCHPRGETYGGAGGEGEGEGEGETMTRESHQPWFPVADSDTHGGVGCGQCHSDYGGDWSGTLCSECHLEDLTVLTNTAHSTLSTIYEANDSTTGCRECHSSTPVENILIMPFTDHNARTNNYGISHYLPEHCRVCHTTRLAEPQEWAIDFSQVTCTAACHGSGEPHGAGCLPGNTGPC